MASNNPNQAINLISKCRKNKLNVSLLITVLRLIDRGLIRHTDDLGKYLNKRVERSPRYNVDAKKIEEMLSSSILQT